MTSPKPFRRSSFEALPEAPRLAHGYGRSSARALELDSRHFGRFSVHVRQLGSGPPLLLVHGLMTSSYSFRYVLEPLARSYRVIAPDLPGAGRSDKPAASYGPDALAGFIVELAGALGIRGCPAVGNSLGGYLCMRAVLRDAGVFSRLVNLHSPGIPELRLYALNAALRVPGARELLARLARRSPERWAHRNVHYFDESLKSREEAREYGAPLATADGARAFASYMAETLAPGPMRSFVRELRTRGFPIPLLLVYADRDPMVPPKVGERLHTLLPGAELRWLTDSSHFAHVDSPDRLLALIEPFLAGQQTPPPPPE